MLNPPLTKAFSIVPNDGADLAEYTRAISVNAAGNIAIQLTGGGDVVLNALAGVLYYVQVKRVKATGTAATGIIGWN